MKMTGRDLCTWKRKGICRKGAKCSR